MQLDPRRILIFRTVAREGSVSGGARALGWTQPAVSQHIRLLEEEVGQALLLRSSTGVTLTEAGERLLRHADGIAGLLGSAEAELASLAEGAGSVTIAAFPSALADFVPRAIAAARLAAPGLTARVIEVEPPEAIEAVLAGDADIAVAFEYDELHDDVQLTRIDLGPDPSRIVLPAAHGLARSSAIDIASLAGDDWVGGCERCRAHLESLAADAGFSPRIQFETDDFVAAQAFVSATGSVTLLPDMALRALTRDDVVVVPLADGSGRTVSLRHRHGAERVPAVQTVLDALQRIWSERVA
ncbi:LysR family transcriptional regulator [Agrococcus beijingensis]|uniref:LysR family transcriptional regulator n=1 Tax=Agrococcus beijingensis TaxID=3068634 RepID=UPI0027426F72|nr:LysR family transcriptional regulator [Agrococcus sp. REN33]